MTTFTTHNDFEEIVAAVVANKSFILSEENEKKYQMLMHAAKLIQEFGMCDKSIKRFVELYVVSENTARNYLNAGPRIYEIAFPLQSANFYRGMVLAKILETRSLIEAVGDEKFKIQAYNQNDKNLLEFNKSLPSAEAVDWDKMSPKVTINNFEPSLVVEAEMSDDDLRREMIKLGLAADKEYTDYEES